MSIWASFGLFALSAGLYAWSLVQFFTPFARAAAPKAPTNAGALQRGARILAAAGLLHLSYVLVASMVAHVCPIDSIHFLLSVSALVAIAGYSALRRRFRIEALGLFVAPLGLLSLLGTFMIGAPARTGTANPVFMAAHILTNLLGTGLFALAGAAAVLFLFQAWRLRHKRVFGFGQLPSLEALDQAQLKFLLGAFPLLTLGVRSGTRRAPLLEIGRPDVAVRTVLSYVTWLLMAAVLALRLTAGWTGRRASIGTLIAAGCLGLVWIFYLTASASATGAP